MATAYKIKAAVGMDLEGTGRDFRFTMSSWHRRGELLVMGGWQPAETSPPSDWYECRDGRWGGGYGSNDGGRVSDRDARLMADALERILPEIPDRDTLQTPPKARDFSVDDRVQHRGHRREGTVMGFRTRENLVVVRWDEFGEEFDGNCNDIRNFVAPDVLNHTDLSKALPRGISLGVAERTTAFDWFSGPEEKNHLREFVAYCRKGGFALR